MPSVLATLLAVSYFLPKLILGAPTNKDGEVVSHKQIFALTRDNLGREDPDALLGGFIPVWACVIFAISASFLVVAILATGCFLCGCRNNAKNQRKHTVLTNY